MKTAVIFKSVTGNTASVAEAIRKALPENDTIYFGEPKDNIEADLYIVGSWTDKGTCAEEIRTFLQSLKGKKIAFFGTAGFSGSEAYYQSIFQRIRESIGSDNEISGSFFCQGKMPAAIRERYEKLLQTSPDDKRIQASIENFDKALTHPDKTDFENAEAWIKSITENL